MFGCGRARVFLFGEAADSEDGCGDGSPACGVVHVRSGEEGRVAEEWSGTILADSARRVARLGSRL
jgi:hypothetical protein